jgi:hypothetical protein
MGAAVFARLRGFIVLPALTLALGCTDEKDPAYLASLLSDPIETENALEKLRKNLDERMQQVDPVAVARSTDDFARRSTSALVETFKRSEGNPMVQNRIVAVLTRTLIYTTSEELRKKVIGEVFLPVMERFRQQGENPTQVAMIVDTLASLMQPPSGDTPLLTPEQVTEAVGKMADVTASIRAGWGCQKRLERGLGANTRVADQEQLLLSCLQAVSRMVGHDAGVGAQAKGVAILVDGIRESFEFQDFFLNRAATEAANDVAEKLVPDQVRVLAPALIEGLFLQGDFFLFPYARRALIHLAAASDANREIVAEELLKALGVDMDPAVAEVLPEVATYVENKNERLDLLRLPCGAAIGVACEQTTAEMREYRDKQWAAGRAPCNRGIDPNRPGSGFQWGFNYEVVWDKFGAMLVDIVSPLEPGRLPDQNTKVGLAVNVLRTEIRLMAEWVENVKALKRLLEAAADLYPDLMKAAAETPAAPAEGATPAAPATPPAEPTFSETVAPVIAEIKTRRESEATKLDARTRELLGSLFELLRLPEADAKDIDGAKQIVAAAFADVQSELIRLADFDNDYQAINLRLWRTISAARALSMLGITGPDDDTLKQMLRITQFSLDNLMGFRITPLRAFPQMTLRFRQQFTAEGMPMVAQPAIPALLDTIQNFQHPTQEVMNFLLHMLAASSLTGENQNATVSAERFSMMNMDVTTFRAIASRVFYAAFRHDPVLPDADRYLDLFKSYTGDVQYLLALEKTNAIDPAFQFYPPMYRLPDGTASPIVKESPAWLEAPPPDPREQLTFDIYRDPLLQCVYREPESSAHAATWRREMDDAAKTAYCQKWVEPWATEFASQMRDQDIPRLEIADWRCWYHMKDQHDKRFQYCLDKENARNPAVELNLTDQECKAVKELDDTYFYCSDLRFEPQYVEKNKPTLWGCYDTFPWLRRREPIGPTCTHLSQRILAAYLYVKFRQESGVQAPDGVTFTRLNEILPLDEYMNFVKTFGTEQDPAMFAKVNELTQELAKVQAEVPTFRRPPRDTDRISRTELRKPEDTRGPTYVPTPWYWHDDWIERTPRSFAELREDFMVECRPEEEETATVCAPDGGKIGNQFKITVEGGAPGPMMEEANSLAIMVMRQDLVGIAHMRDAVVAIESDCYAGGNYDVGCVARTATASIERERTLFVNSACRAMVREALEVCDPKKTEIPASCPERIAQFEQSICREHFTRLDDSRPITPAELMRRGRAIYLLAAVGRRDMTVAEQTLGDLLLAVNIDPVNFMTPVTFAYQKVRPGCCPAGQAECDRLGCRRLHLFARYWAEEGTHDNQVPDIEALYYTLLASR